MERPGVYRVLTLTSSSTSGLDIHRSFRALKERIRRRWKFEYLAVRELTESGLIHMHLVYRGSYMPQGLISRWWAEIHDAPVIWVAPLRGVGEIKGYLAKYLAKEQYGRWFSSWGWVYRRWRGAWHCFWVIVGNGGCCRNRRLGLELWGEHLRNRWVWFAGMWWPPPAKMEERLASEGAGLWMDWVALRFGM